MGVISLGARSRMRVARWSVPEPAVAPARAISRLAPTGTCGSRNKPIRSGESPPPGRSRSSRFLAALRHGSQSRRLRHRGSIAAALAEVDVAAEAEMKKNHDA